MLCVVYERWEDSASVQETVPGDVCSVCVMGRIMLGDVCSVRVKGSVVLGDVCSVRVKDSAG